MARLHEYQGKHLLKSHKIPIHSNYRHHIDDQGLISQDAKFEEPSSNDAGETVIVETIQPTSKPQSLEKLQEGFNKLIEQLRDINEHLNIQSNQNKELVDRMEKLPNLIESFPNVVENQKQLTEQLFEQLKSASIKNQQFVDAVEKIPSETSKQTDALVEIDHQLAAAAEADVQMGESFNKFNETLDKLNQSTANQTDSIMQMSKTFATSDRYLKYLMSRQNKRFMWMSITAIGLCVLVALTLAGIIIYLKQ